MILALTNMYTLSTIVAVSFMACVNAFMHSICTTNNSDPITNNQSICNLEMQLDMDGNVNLNINLMQKLWHSIGDTVSSDLEYLKSLTITPSCHEKIETEYFQHILYPVIHKDQPFSYNLQNLCPFPNPLTIPKPKPQSLNQKPPKTFRIIYLIIMYKDPSQVLRLISALNTSMDHFLIHIDAKSSQDVSTPIVNHAQSHFNIHIVNYI